MSEPKRYDKMSRSERIEDSDRVAVIAIINKLTKDKKKKLYFDFQSFLRDLEEKYGVGIRVKWKPTQKWKRGDSSVERLKAPPKPER